MPHPRPSGFGRPQPLRALVKEDDPLSGVYPSTPPVPWDAVQVCAWPDCGCAYTRVCTKRMASLLSPHPYRPGAVHLQDSDGWVSPYEAGDPRCSLSGEWSAMGRGRMSAGAWVLLAFSLTAACGLGLAVWSFVAYARMRGW